jgi:hypothetical protein
MAAAEGKGDATGYENSGRTSSKKENEGNDEKFAAPIPPGISGKAAGETCVSGEGAAPRDKDVGRARNSASEGIA